MKNFLLLLASTILLASVARCETLQMHTAASRHLFVGNSITYEYDTPGLLQRLLAAYGKKTVVVDAIVGSGETMKGHERDGLARKAIESNRYGVVFLQEQGGLLLCASDPPEKRSPECAASVAAHRGFVEAAHRSGALVVLLGTFQPVPEVQSALSKAEADVAREVGADGHIDQNRWQSALMNRLSSNFHWFAGDGMHPGIDAALLTAILAYREITSSLPALSGSGIAAKVCEHELGKGSRRSAEFGLQPLSTNKGCESINLDKWKKARELLSRDLADSAH